MDNREEVWRLINRRTVVKDPWLEVFEDDYELPDGSRMEAYYAMRERSGVIVVALTPLREILAVRQFRAGIGEPVYEIPAGFLEEGETDALERAKKELREETGYTSDEWRDLGIVHDVPARMDKTSYCFLALNVRKVAEQREDATEFVRYEHLPLQTFLRMIRDGRVTSAVMIAALFKALLLLDRVPTD